MTVIPKPPFGGPCNGCGLCCRSEQCNLSVSAFGPQVLCPAIIEQPGGTVGCGLVLFPAGVPLLPGREDQVKAAAFALVLGSGAGCDAVGDDEADDPAVLAATEARAMSRIADAPVRVQIAVVELLVSMLPPPVGVT